jgi:hypothetical protein
MVMVMLWLFSYTMPLLSVPRSSDDDGILGVESSVVAAISWAALVVAWMTESWLEVIVIPGGSSTERWGSFDDTAAVGGGSDLEETGASFEGLYFFGCFRILLLSGGVFFSIRFSSSSGGCVSRMEEPSVVLEDGTVAEEEEGDGLRPSSRRGGEVPDGHSFLEIEDGIVTGVVVLVLRGDGDDDNNAF